MNYIFSNNIKLIRKHLDMTQTEFADKIGATRGMILQYEHRGSRPNYQVINAITDLTKLSFDFLITKELTHEKLSVVLPEAEKKKSDVLKRLDKVITVLKERGAISTYKDIAKTLGYDQKTISNVIAGSVKLADKFLLAFCTKYYVSIHWIKNGEGDIFLHQSVETKSTNHLGLTANTEADNEFSIFLREKRREFDLTKAMLSYFSGKPLADITAWEEGTLVASPEIQASLYNFFKDFKIGGSA